MTLDEFIDALSKTPREVWLLSELLAGGSAIRARFAMTRSSESCCPITAVYPSRPSAAAWRAVSERLGLSHDDARLIVKAADDDHDHDPALRARLLAACGLRERSEPEPVAGEAPGGAAEPEGREG